MDAPDISLPDLLRQPPEKLRALQDGLLRQMEISPSPRRFRLLPLFWGMGFRV